VGIGERYGSRSSNQGTAYLLSSFASVGAAAAAGFGAVLILHDEKRYDRFPRGVLYSVVPNAFLNAYVYNRVKEAAAGDGSSGVSVAPYVAAYSGGRGAPMSVYGLALSF
jgi:threonine/homoserine efflux transporter RhtA